MAIPANGDARFSNLDVCETIGLHRVSRLTSLVLLIIFARIPMCYVTVSGVLTHVHVHMRVKAHVQIHNAELSMEALQTTIGFTGDTGRLIKFTLLFHYTLPPPYIPTHHHHHQYTTSIAIVYGFRKPIRCLKYVDAAVYNFTQCNVRFNRLLSKITYDKTDDEVDGYVIDKLGYDEARKLARN